jgi:hypothetical protein
MAKDKEFEKIYKEQKRIRISERKKKRKERWTERVRIYGRGSKQCETCGSYASWCSCCEVWSFHCCGNDYGTCQCS